MIKSIVAEYIRRRAKWIVAYAILTINSPIFMVVEPYFIGRVIEKLPTLRHDVSGVRYDAAAIAGLYILAQAASSGCDYIDAIFVPGLQTAVRQHLLNRITLQNLRHVTDVHVGDVISKIAEAPFALSELVQHCRSYGMPLVYTSVGAAIYLCTVHWSLALIFVAGLVLFGLGIYLIGRRCMREYVDCETHYDMINEETADYLENLPNVYDSNATTYEARRMSAHHATMERKLTTALNSGATLRLITSAINYIVYLAIIVVAIWLYTKGILRVGAVSTVVMIIAYVMSVTGNIASELPRIVAYVAVLEKIDNFLATLRADGSVDSAGSISERVPKATGGSFTEGRIDVMDGTYKLAETTVLTKVTTTFQPHRITLVTGPIGSGKSTLLKLINGSLSLTAGAIYIDNRDIAKTSAAELRAAVVTVGQMPKLFNRTTFENIAYGSPTTSVQDVVDILETYNIQFVRIHDMLGKGGSRLSGGQRQIIMLLRALVRTRDSRCKIILLDEPTASLDSVARRLAIRIIHDMVRGRTTLIVTHDQELERLARDRFVMVPSPH